MPYVAAFISPTAGLVIPGYADIRDDLISQYLAIYPQVVYLDPSQAKYQEISIFALKTYDVFLAIQLDYNSRGPLTAVGSALDQLGKIMGGTARLASTYSTAPMNITGAAGTVITNGTVTDTQGNIWALPISITIPPAGLLLTSVTVTKAGAISAAAGAIRTISGGATAGWTGASNPSAANAGQPIEADSKYRGRMALSVALPSRTTLAGTIAGIAGTPNVTRYNVHENFTGAVDAAGTPPHSVSAVVEGGTDLAVATAIFANRGIGPLTNGTTTVPVTDPSTGAITDIGFSRPGYVDIYVVMQIRGLNGYSSAVISLIEDALVDYLNSLQIGETLTYSSLYAVAQSVMPSLTVPQFSVTSVAMGTAPGPNGTVDVAVNYNQVVRGTYANLSVTAV